MLRPAAGYRRGLVETRPGRLTIGRSFIKLPHSGVPASTLVLIHNNAADFESIRGAIERSPGRFPKLGPLGLIRCESLV